MKVCESRSQGGHMSRNSRRPRPSSQLAARAAACRLPRELKPFARALVPGLGACNCYYSQSAHNFPTGGNDVDSEAASLMLAVHSLPFVLRSPYAGVVYLVYRENKEGPE